MKGWYRRLEHPMMVGVGMVWVVEETALEMKVEAEEYLSIREEWRDYTFPSWRGKYTE